MSDHCNDDNDCDRNDNYDHNNHYDDNDDYDHYNDYDHNDDYDHENDDDNNNDYDHDDGHCENCFEYNNTPFDQTQFFVTGFTVLPAFCSYLIEHITYQNFDQIKFDVCLKQNIVANSHRRHCLSICNL